MYRMPKVLSHSYQPSCVHHMRKLTHLDSSSTLIVSHFKGGLPWAGRLEQRRWAAAPRAALPSPEPPQRRGSHARSSRSRPLATPWASSARILTTPCTAVKVSSPASRLRYQDDTMTLVGWLQRHVDVSPVLMLACEFSLLLDMACSSTQAWSPWTAHRRRPPGGCMTTTRRRLCAHRSRSTSRQPGAALWGSQRWPPRCDPLPPTLPTRHTTATVMMTGAPFKLFRSVLAAVSPQDLALPVSPVCEIR